MAVFWALFALVSAVGALSQFDLLSLTVLVTVLAVFKALVAFVLAVSHLVLLSVTVFVTVLTLDVTVDTDVSILPNATSSDLPSYKIWDDSINVEFALIFCITLVMLILSPDILALSDTISFTMIGRCIPFDVMPVASNF
ncbi:hypothetical protein [[Eubacterium] hominis]|uniref:hypothetical protein n=1 Tax=[Eubacterium] hominis TaxID=2764325 RepID=UPI0023DDCA3A